MPDFPLAATRFDLIALRFQHGDAADRPALGRAAAGGRGAGAPVAFFAARGRPAAVAVRGVPEPAKKRELRSARFPRQSNRGNAHLFAFDLPARFFFGHFFHGGTTHVASAAATSTPAAVAARIFIQVAAAVRACTSADGRRISGFGYFHRFDRRRGGMQITSRRNDNHSD